MFGARKLRGAAGNRSGFAGTVKESVLRVPCPDSCETVPELSASLVHQNLIKILR